MKKETIDSYRESIKRITSGSEISETVDVCVDDLQQMLDELDMKYNTREIVQLIVYFIVGVALGYLLNGLLV